MSTRLTLRATDGGLTGQEITLTAPASCTLGRSSQCDVRLPHDPKVSRSHCLIEVQPQGAWLQDLGSLNGTRVNGEVLGPLGRSFATGASWVVTPRRGLKDGDEIRIAGNVFRVAIAAAQG